MKILFPFVGDTVGGSHVAAISLIKSISETDIEPIVLIHQKGRLEDYLQEHQIDYICQKIGHIVPEGNIFKQLMVMVRNITPLSNFLSENKIDIVHTNDLRMHYSWLLPTYFNKKSKHVWHQNSFSRSYRLALFSFFTDKVLTISQYCHSNFPALFQKKSKVIHNPFECEVITVEKKQQYQTALHEELGLAANIKIIGFVGNLTQQKRPDFFLKIAADLLRQNKELHFVFIGEAKPQTNQQLIDFIDKNNLESFVTLAGTRFPIAPYMAGFDVLVAPAKNEGLGRTIIESMFAGTPVVAANHGGHQELIDHERTGYLCDPDNAKEFAKVILKLISASDIKNKITKSAQKNVEQEFLLQNYAESVIDVYNNI